MHLEPAYESQLTRYNRFYSGLTLLERLVRFDIRYRVRRLHEVLDALGVETEGKRILDVGFGWGDMLASFPHSCSVVGCDISPSAVMRARLGATFHGFNSATFHRIHENDADSLPSALFDIILCSHVLEHVPDDDAVLRAMRARLAPDGVLIVFVPVEPPDYSPIHLRTYSVQSITERVVKQRLQLLHNEGSMYVEGHIFRILSIPTRRRWPVFRYVAAALKHITLSLPPYRLLKVVDRVLFRLGLPACQAMVVAARTPRMP